jgi:sulfate adenylyltransferase subunit 2
MTALSANLTATGVPTLSHLDWLEAEAIHILREVAGQCAHPALLFSGGKDSIVLLHLATKAFRPARFPLPLLHIDTGHNFPEVIAFRDARAAELGERLIVRSVEDSIAAGRVVLRSPDESRNRHQSVTLLDAIAEFGFDALIGGARRDEEKARAKERVFSFRDRHHRWDPKNQRPELWNLFNTRINQGESIRVFPMSNWTELDVWLYIWKHGLPVVPLYLAKPRPVVERGGTLIMVDDHRMPLEPGEKPRMLSVRFRTLGCYPLSGAVESEADTLDKVIEEMLRAKTSERQGRLIDHDQSGSMEEKKREGYF